MKTTFGKMHLHSIPFAANNILLLSALLIAVFLSVLSAQTFRIDSVSVDSVWNSDSTWFDWKDTLITRQSRDCKLSFVPTGKGTVQTIVSLSIDSGKTWAVQTDGFNRLFPCGIKSSLIVRILGGDKPGAAFRITGRQYKPVITGNPHFIYYPNDLYPNGLPIYDLPEHSGTSAVVPVKLQLADSSSKGYSEITKAYWDAMGDGTWDDSTTSLNWTWSTTVPFGEVGQRRAIIAKVRDANGLWSNPETLTVIFGVNGEVPIFSEDFESDLSNWGQHYMVDAVDFYPRMRITPDASFSGFHSITTDSNRTALVYNLSGDNRLSDRICGVQFYLMAKAKGEINFTLELGQYAGSSGGLSKAFGIGFDVRDSIKVTNYDAYVGRTDNMCGAIIPGHWYKCKIEIDFTNKKTAYYIDDKKINEGTLPTIEMYGIDRLLIFRGQEYLTSDQDVIPCSEGPKPYYIDNIVLYKKVSSPINETPAIFISEGFEGDLSKYKQVTYALGQAKMSISKQYAHSGNGSLTSDSNNTGIKCVIDPAIMDSIAGLQFYLMATKRSQTNTIAMMARPGSSANGLFTIMGMGISKSDSLELFYENAPDDPSNFYKNFAQFELNKWYKCKIEYNYNNSTLMYYLDDKLVYTKAAPDPMTLSVFVVMRDGLGAQGPSGYYIDDVYIYKR